MSEIVLDASAVLALIFDEPGAERFTAEMLDRSVLSAVNLAEVQTKLLKKGYSPEEAWEDAQSLARIESFPTEQARIAGNLLLKTEKFGLSLGDRSCLALAIALRAPVYTTEKIWRKLEIGIPIHVIR
jgi:PIN domain nuclease of toxin-antitoxin system